MARKVFWKRFRTQKELTEKIRLVIGANDIGEAFESELLSDLIAERHYACAPLGLRPTLFKKVPNKEYPSAPYAFMAFFGGLIGWRGVSWTKCVRGRADSVKEMVAKALRDRVSLLMRDLKQYEFCACGAPAQEVHHSAPTFVEIVESIVEEHRNDIESAVALYDWREIERFSIPESNPLIATFDRLHNTSTLTPVCKKCHPRKRV